MFLLLDGDYIITHFQLQPMHIYMFLEKQVQICGPFNKINVILPCALGFMSIKELN